MIDVTCAIIRNEEDEILVVQRGEKSDHPLKWEFPGGKIMKGETEEDCIIREIKEELSIEIVICRKLNDVEYDYGIKKIRLIPFICDTLDDMPFLSEHVAYKWVNIKDLTKIDFSEADVFVAEDYVQTVSPDDLTKGEKPSGISQPDEAEIREMVNRIMGMKEAEWMAASLTENPLLFRKFIEFSYSDDQKLAFHASWIITKVCDKSPEIIYPYLPDIVESLKGIRNESALRSFLRILSMSDPGKLSQRHHGLLADVCFSYLNSGFAAIAIKAYSMEILYRLTLIYPELATELALSMKGVTEMDSAGIVSKAKAILKKLNK
ncbi:MAG TPA: (deoxy)nucleoside triphosphate pyrophosphohydrolase [Bacteroidales bacterium]|nr:(deoxy)nucleoside triphosphate pyrophosphohydrolase [Bacteroidales bacterium]